MIESLLKIITLPCTEICDFKADREALKTGQNIADHKNGAQTITKWQKMEKKMQIEPCQVKTHKLLAKTLTEVG